MPNDVLSKSDMEDVLVDYHMARAMTEDLPSNERYKQALYMDYVFKKHGITEAEFNSSLKWYSRYTEDFAKIYTEVNKRLLAQKNDINHLISATGNDQQESKNGDSINVWHKQLIYKLTQSAATNKVYFTIYPDSNYKERDALIWSVRYTFVSAKQQQQDAVMSMTIKYTNDSVLTETRNIDRSGIYNIRLQNDSSTYKIKEIKGFVYYNQLSHYLQDALIIDRISLTRYHSKKAMNTSKKPIAVNINKSDSLKKDSMKKQVIKPATINDNLMRNNLNTGPRRRTKSGSNDMRKPNQPVMQPPTERIR